MYPCVLIVLFRNMCWNLLTSTGHTTSKYLYAGDVVGPGEWIPLPQVFRIRWFNSNIVILISNCKQKVKCLLFTIYRWLWHWSKTASPGSANKWCCRVGWCPWEICGKQVSLCFTCKSSFCLCSKHSWFTLIYTLTDIVTDVNCCLLMFRVKRVGIHGIEYRPGCVLRLREMDDVENDYPVYGQVDEIIVWEDEKFFILTELATLSFHHHFMAYEVDRTDHKAVVLRHDLQWYGVLHIVQKNGKKFIVEKDTCCIEDVL